MEKLFADAVNSLQPSFDSLMAREPIRGDRFPLDRKPDRERLAGVYLYTEVGKHLYVGRSNDIARRFYMHRRPSSGDGVAPFAYRLACVTSGRTGVSYVKGHPDSRACKMADDDFHWHFQQAKDRIKQMDFRYVIQSDPVTQALLEVYCAVVLQTPHNLFDTH